MQEYNEDDIRNAIVAVENGMSQRKAASQYKIPRNTLAGRLRGSVTRKQAHIDRQKLSPTEEQSLVDWVRIQAALNAPPTHEQLRLAAQHLLRSAGSQRTIGPTWTTCFLRRHESLRTLKGKQMEKARVEAVTPDLISKFFDVFNEPLIQKIRHRDRWNMDETGIMEGIVRDETVIAPADQKKVVIKIQKRSQWTSIVECISAEGNMIPPLVIWQGATVQQQYYPEGIEQLQKFRTWKFFPTENGYISNESAVEWLKKIFIPFTATGRNDWRLLVLDGHECHRSDEFVHTCYKNKIWLATLPAHSSHITQPLDVGVFAALKIYYRKHARNNALLSNFDEISRADFLECYYKARQEAFTIRNIRSGWQKTGLWPLNVSKPLNNPRLFKNELPKPQSTTPPSESSQDTIKTPKIGDDVRKYAHEARMNGVLQLRHQQLILRKVGKALDQKNAEIADLHRKNSHLQKLYQKYKPKKRGKVVPDQNELFCTIEDVVRARADVTARQRQLLNQDPIDLHGIKNLFDC